MEYDEFSAMNTVVLAAAEGERQALAPGFAEVRQFVADSEQRFSRFRESSELSRLNRAAGHWFTASPALFELVQTALHLHRLTGGLFDPAILAALKQAGYNHSLPRYAPPSPAVAAWESPSFSQTQLDEARRAIRLPAGTTIDLGGIAKGWIAAGAAALLAQFSPACAVSAGGDMVLVGHPSFPLGEGEQAKARALAPARENIRGAWQIALEDPRAPDQVLAILNVGPGALATSTVTRRRWQQGDQLRHHIIDPRDGLPARSSWLSVTVFTEKATDAEALAKALLIADPRSGALLAGRVAGLRFVAVQSDGTLWGTAASQEIIDVTEPVDLSPAYTR